MSELIIKKGNKVILDIPIYDGSGALITTLATATSVRFNIKASPNSVPLVEKTLDAGIAVNTPSTGYIRVTLTPTDTSLPPRVYYMGLQIIWTAGDEIYEIFIKVDGAYTDKLKIIQDNVNKVKP